MPANSKDNNKITGYLLAILAAILLGCTGVFIRNISTDVNNLNFLRIFIGLIFLTLFLFFRKELGEVKKVKLSIPLFITGVCLALIGLCYINALKYTSLTNAVFLLYLGPIIAIIFSFIFFKEKLNPINFLIIAITFLGFLFVLEFKFTIGSSQTQRYLWGLGAGILFALFIVFNRIIAKDISGLKRSFYQILFACITMMLFIDDSIFQISKKDFLWITAMAFFQGFLAFVFLITAIKYLKTHEYGVISYLEPLIASFLGFLLYHEIPSILQLIGYVLIFCTGIAQISANKIKFLNN